MAVASEGQGDSVLDMDFESALATVSSAEPEAPVSTDAPQSAETETPADAEPTSSATPTTDASAPAAPATATETQPTPAPPWTPKGAPFRFKVDGTEVTPEGAVVTPEGYIVFPSKQIWEQQIQGRYVGNRDAWRQKEATYRQQIHDLDPSRHPDLVQARAQQKVMDQLLSSPPEQVAAILDNMRLEMPMRLAQAKAEILEERENARQQEVAAQREAEADAKLETDLQNHLGQQVEQLVAAGPYKLLAEDKAEVLEFLRDAYAKYGAHLYGAIDPHQIGQAVAEGAQVIGQAKGKALVFYPDRLAELGNQRVGKITQWRERHATTTKAEARNAATLAAPQASKPVARPAAPRPRTETGQFAQLSERDKKRIARERLDNMTLEDALRD